MPIDQPRRFDGKCRRRRVALSVELTNEFSRICRASEHRQYEDQGDSVHNCSVHKQMFPAPGLQVPIIPMLEGIGTARPCADLGESDVFSLPARESRYKKGLFQSYVGRHVRRCCRDRLDTFDLRGACRDGERCCARVDGNPGLEDAFCSCHHVVPLAYECPVNLRPTLPAIYFKVATKVCAVVSECFRQAGLQSRSHCGVPENLSARKSINARTRYERWRVGGYTA